MGLEPPVGHMHGKFPTHCPITLAQGEVLIEIKGNQGMHE